MKPILFSTPMVQAILDGRKTMTRRVVKNKGKNKINENGSYSYINKKDNTFNGGNSSNIPEIMIDILSPYKVGDILWVREPFVIEGMRFNEDGTITHHEEPIVHYKADKEDLRWFDEWEDEVNIPWKPSIHMNKELARIFLRVTNVRIERLQDIQEDDIVAEGLPLKHWTVDDAYDWWIRLWNSINGKGAWEANPYVFVYEFEKVEKPI